MDLATDIGIGDNDDLKMTAETELDLVTLTERTEISKSECLKIVQSVCKKLANEGDEMMFMTVNLTQKSTTCVGSQLGVNFLNHKPLNLMTEELPNISEMFQQFLEDHYEISNVCNSDNTPFSPADSVIMHSPAYTPFSSPRAYRAYKQPTDSNNTTEKLLTPKLEVLDSEYDGNSTAPEDMPSSPYTNTLPRPVSVQAIPNSPNAPPGSQARPILAKLLSPNIRNEQPFPRFSAPGNQITTFPRLQIPKNRTASNFPPYQPNTTILSRLLAPAIPASSTTSAFQPTVSPLVTSELNKTNNNLKQLLPVIPYPKRTRKKKNSPKHDNDDAETDDTESESSSQKMVTLRSGRKVKVPAWRRFPLENALKAIQQNQVQKTDIQIKQERISPTLEDNHEKSVSPTFQDNEEDVHVEFDFDILAELKKESGTDQDQSDGSSWCGTVQITSSADDSTPSKVPFKFNFDKNKSSTIGKEPSNLDINTSSLGLVRKPQKDQEEEERESTTTDGKFKFQSMYDVVNIEGVKQYRCKKCLHLFKATLSLRNHCYTHQDFIEENNVCQVCDRVFNNSEDLKEHSETHDNSHTCHICNETFLSKLSLIQHLNWVHKEMFSCPKCASTFTSSKSLSHHMETCLDHASLVSRAGVKLMTDEWVGVNEDGDLAYKCRSCKVCFSTVEEYNHHMLQHRTKFVRDVNKKMEKVMSAEENTNKGSPVSTAMPCEQCHKLFESEVHLKRHMRLKHGKNKDKKTSPSFKCSLCDIYFDAEVDFSSHCMTYHPSNTKIKTENAEEFNCDKCAKRMQTKEGLELHQKIHDETSKQCRDCGSFFYTEASMQLHDCKRETSDFKCNECGTYFFSCSYLTGHLNHVHGKPLDEIEVQKEKSGKITCNVCGRVFKKSSDLAAHKSVHTGELPFTCHLCSKKFRLRSTLKSHLMTHRDYHEFICEVCGRTFKLMESLRLHKRLHNKTCYFKCKHCPKEFRAYDGLKYHMLRSHREMVTGNNLKIYRCEYCGKDMATHQQYVRHVSIHTNNKPLKCEICDTRWATISQLNAHKKKHDADHLKFGCDVCQKKFPIRSKLHRHMKTAKHIENCTIRNLPVDTITLEQVNEPAGTTVTEASMVIDNTVAETHNLGDNIEIMYYEIKMSDDQNDENPTIYDVVLNEKNDVKVGNGDTEEPVVKVANGDTEDTVIEVANGDTEEMVVEVGNDDTVNTVEEVTNNDTEDTIESILQLQDHS